mgnify:CR=1 FL=1
MEVIPAIDLLDGKCVRLNKGDFSRVTQFNSNPSTQALLWEEQGASIIHVVDLDGAKTGLPVNDISIRQIIKNLKIPIQVGGGIRTIARAEELIQLGVQKVILGTLALEEPSQAMDLASAYPGQVIIGIDSKKGKVATRGWIKENEKDAVDLVQTFNDSEIAAIIFTDIDTDGTLEGPNLNAMREIANKSKLPLIASGGVGSMSDLISLLELEVSGVSGVIVGRAIYDGKIKLKEAIQALKNGPIQDFPIKGEFFA